MRKFFLVTLLLVSAVATAPASGAPAVLRAVAVPAQVDALRVDAVTTYRLEPEAGVVRVTVEATLTNTEPARQRGNVVETPYYDTFGSAAIGPVANALADRDGNALATSVETGDTDDVEFIVADLVPDLVFGAPQTISIRYDIPAQPSRSDYATRINDAFAAWYVVGTGNSGAVDIVIDVPDRFAVEFTETAVPPAVRADGRAVYRLDDLTDPEAFFGVSVRDDDALVRRPTTVDDDTFEVQAWPGDEEWAGFAVDAVARGIPAVVDRVGLELAGAREIAIGETATPYQYGYAGWFLPDEDRIEIGDELDLQVMLHELSHLWFNFDLFDQRWIGEGLAEVVSNDVARSLDVEPVAVEPIDPGAPGAQPLNEWTNPGPDEDAAAIEGYGYRASYAVLQSLVDEIGADGLRNLIVHADADRIAYLGDPDPEESFQVFDWRYLYDVAEHVVGSEQIAGLLDQYALSEEDRAAVAARAVALERYEALTESGDGWTPPLEVRRRMGAWDFARATESMDVATGLLDARARLAADLGTRSVPVPAALEASYESARDLAETSARFRAVAGAAPAVLAADAAVDDAGPLERIGLFGTSAHDDRDAALAAFAAGETERADRLADDVLAATDGAARAAALRLGGLVVGIAGVVIGVVAFRRRRRDSGTYPASMAQASGAITVLPPREIEGHTPSQPQGADHPMRIMTRRAAGLTGPPWDADARAEVTALFDGLAPEWHTRSSESRNQVVLDALDRGGVGGRIALELGSGIGTYSRALSERFERVLALDVSEEMLRLATGEPGLRVLADSAVLPVPDGAVDAVVLINMLLFPDEVDRVLAPGGTVVWVNSSGESTPIHLLPDEVATALPGSWVGISSRAGVGLWAVLQRE